MWVQQMLGDCEVCNSPESGACTVMKELASNHATAGGEDRVEPEGNSSDWTGEGSSENFSSGSDHNHSKVLTPAGGLKAGSHSRGAAVSGKAKGKKTQDPDFDTLMDTALGEKLPTMLLVGDSNAVGYCETRDYMSSLRRALSSSWQLHIAAKSGARWTAIAQDVDANLQQFYTTGPSRKLTDNGSKGLAKATFSRILFVLGTNDVPKKAHEKKRG